MKKLIFNLLRVLVSAALVVYVVTMIDLGDVWETLSKTRVGWLAFWFLVFFLDIFVCVMRWRLLLGVQGVRVGLLDAVRLTFIGMFFNNFLPGITGGDVAKAYLISRETEDRKEGAVVSVFMDRVVGLVGLMTMASVFLLFLLGQHEFRAPALIIYGFLALLLLGGVVFYSRRLRRLLIPRWLLNILPLKEMIRRVDHAVFAYRFHKKVIVLGVILSIVGQSIGVIVTYGIARAMNLEQVTLLMCFVLLPVCWTISALPVSVAGLGMTETAFVHFFSLVGIARSDALAWSLLYRVTMVGWSLVGGIVLALGKKRAI